MKLVIGNLKMNLISTEIECYVNSFKDKNYFNVFFAPSSIYLTKFMDNGLNTVSQDVSPFEKGAYTGDISACQLKNIGINYSLVGHSERRKYYHDDDFINEKIKRLLEQEINPILCLGESLEQRNKHEYLDQIKMEIDEAFKDIDKDKLSNTIIAYEPIWAIGTGKIPSNNEIEEVIQFIKKYVLETYGYQSKVLYGGSINNDNINILEEINDLDGYLVGGCSLSFESFNELIERVR